MSKTIDAIYTKLLAGIRLTDDEYQAMMQDYYDSLDSQVPASYRLDSLESSSDVYGRL